MPIRPNIIAPSANSLTDIPVAPRVLCFICSSDHARAVRWIREHYQEPVLVADLAELSSMSASSFHRHFRAATSMTPMTPIQFQKQIRLQEARALLMTKPTRVAEIGYLVGYESPSQFSREYRRTFGTPPGQDRSEGEMDHGA